MKRSHAEALGRFPSLEWIPVPPPAERAKVTPTPAPAQTVTHIPPTELHRPQRTSHIFGNATAVNRIKQWVRQGGKTICMLSGPTGCGKTSLARAALREYGYEVVDSRADEPNMILLVTDLLYTKTTKRRAILVDELENLPTPLRKKLLAVLTKSTPTVPVVCVCTDPSDRAITTFVKACGTKVVMTQPSDAVVQNMLRVNWPTLTMEQTGEIVQAARSDLRQATILADMTYRERNSTTTSDQRADFRIRNVFSAAAGAMQPAVALEKIITCMRYDSLVPMMTQEALATRARRGSSVQATQQEKQNMHDIMADLATRLDHMCDGDLLDAHASHQTHEIAAGSYAAACHKFVARPAAPTPSIPTKMLGIFGKRRTHTAVTQSLARAVETRPRVEHPDPMWTTIARERFKNDALMRKRAEKCTSRADVKKFCEKTF